MSKAKREQVHADSVGRGGRARGAAPRKRGGQELPDEVQDRAEQNAGYDEAVRQGPAGAPKDPLMELDSDLHIDEHAAPAGGNPPGTPSGAEERLEDIDRRAERSAVSEVRRRERSKR